MYPDQQYAIETKSLEKNEIGKSVIAPKPRGRPKDMDKRASILSTARDLFFDRGLEAVKMEEIAHAAGVSKMTVYANFSDKAAIFEAVVQQQGQKMDDAFKHLPLGTEKLMAFWSSLA